MAVTGRASRAAGREPARRRTEEAVVMGEKDCQSRTAGEEGFALIMAILALVLLTFLGLTMAATTSTEVQIAANQRWAEQARYNAEAGLEIGKDILRGVNWANILPQARKTGTGALLKWTTTDPLSPPSLPYTPQTADAWGNLIRDFEMGSCDLRGSGEGYGVVLDDGTTEAPYQYKSTFLGQTLNGTFTIWVRRMTTANNDGSYSDSPDDTQLVLVSEGTAPNTGANRRFLKTHDAVRILETFLSRNLSTSSPCGTRGGQTSQGPEGAGFGCAPVTGEGVGQAFGLGAISDTGAR